MEGDAQSIDNSQPELVTLLLNQIKDYEGERGPKNLSQSWQKTHQAEEDSTARLFLEEGKFPAWFAYFLAKNGAENSGHFTGKADCRRLIAGLEKVSAENRKLLAKRVASNIPPQVKERIQHLENRVVKTLQNDSMTQQSNKRRRTTDSSSYPDTSVGLSTPTATSSGAAAYNSPLDHSTQEQVLANPSFDSSDYFAEDKHVLVNASLVETTDLLPSYLSAAIKRNPDPSTMNRFVAAVALTFPNAPVTDKFGCQMTLEVTENKVEYIARELFGVHLETTAGLRYVYLPGGAKVLPNPTITLRGCRYDTPESIFGPETYNAITASPAFQDDIKRSRDRTDSVSMLISHEAREGAVIFASLGPREGTLIKNKLYKL